MSATWKMIGKGGTDKLKEFFVTDVTALQIKFHTITLQSVNVALTLLSNGSLV